MLLRQLRDAVDAAEQAGIDPNTAVVIYRDGWYYHLDSDVLLPDENEGIVWVTLNPCEDEEADREWVAADPRTDV